MNNTCAVSNKSSGRVVYKIPEMNNLRREFYPHETKRNINVEELEKLSQMPGGLNLLCNYLMVEDAEVLKHLINRDVEPEYWLKDSDIPNWMKTCSLDTFKDALDFAPTGTKDLIKQYAVTMKLNDRAKCAAIKEQLGFDVEKAIELTGDNTAEETPAPKARRVLPSVPEGSSRRVPVNTD